MGTASMILQRERIDVKPAWIEEIESQTGPPPKVN